VTSRLRSLLGRAPIHPALFLIAKLGLVTVLIAPLVQLAGVPVARPLAGLAPLAWALYAGALALAVAAALRLGQALKAGLPEQPTALATTGVYRFSRHPIYLAMYLLALAACLYCPHPVVLAAAILVVVLHHRIALAEEAFLARRFGAAWQAHRARVPRYLGWPRRAAPR
jgi:protein-S-isoprenylcysteine O-methyltransferase Ste14